jgi:hypothetical protein
LFFTGGEAVAVYRIGVALWAMDLHSHQFNEIMNIKTPEYGYNVRIL